MTKPTIRLPLMEPINSLSDHEFLSIYCNHWMRYIDAKGRFWMVTRQVSEAAVDGKPLGIIVVELSTEKEQFIKLNDFREIIENKLFTRLEKPLQIAFSVL